MIKTCRIILNNKLKMITTVYNCSVMSRTVMNLIYLVMNCQRDEPTVLNRPVMKRPATETQP